MTLKTAFTVALLLLFNFFRTQKPEFRAPDYASIRKNIEDKKSEFYYPDLLKKLKQNDTLITQEQYRHLYYGYTFQPDYEPYKIDDNLEEMTKFYRGEISDKDLPKGIKLFRQTLEKNPLDLRAMNYLAYMYHLTKDEVTAKKISRNFHGLLEAFLSSGDGMTCGTGFHVISISHEYVLMNMFEMEAQSQSYDGMCDYQEFEKGKYKIAGLYFNVSKLYGKMSFKR